MSADRSDLVLRRGAPPAPWEPSEPPRSADAGGIPDLGFLRRQRWPIGIAFLAVVVGAVALTLVWPETYESNATILVDRPGGEGAAEIPGLAMVERLERTSTLETEAELITSRRVIGSVVDSLDLHVRVEADGRTYAAAAALPGLDASRNAAPGVYRLERSDGAWRIVADADGDSIAAGRPDERVSFAGLSFRLPSEDAPSRIEIRAGSFPRVVSGTRKRVSVAAAAEEGDVLEVSCEGSTAEGAKRLCEAVTGSYVALRGELQRTSATVTAEFLQDQVEAYELALAAAEDTLETFATENRGVALAEQASEEVRTFAALRAQRDQIEAERQALSGMLGRAERSRGGARAYRDVSSFPTLLRNEAVSQILAHLADLENRRSDLAQRRTELNPELAALDQRISSLDRQLGEMARAYERSLAEQVRSLERAIGGSSGRLSDLPQRQVEMARLERRVAQLGSMYETLQTRLQEARVAEAVREPGVRVVDAASTPVAPSSPRPLMNLALAMVVGLAFGLAVGMVRDRADTRIHGRADVERRTDLPILALLPSVGSAAPVLSVGGPRTPREAEAGDEGEGRLPAVRDRARVAAGPDGNGRSVALEAFRSLGADLQFAARGAIDGDLRSIAITSAGRGDGKTYVACNLALTRAAFGVHTLLVDADMRAAGVGRYLDLDRSPGLGELLRGTAAAREARRVVQVGESGLLSVMTAGEPSADAAGLLETSYFEAMLAGAEAVYDLVIVDTPPLNVLPDTAAVVANVDAVLVVVREDVTDGPALEFTLERLRRVGCPVLGLVYNDAALPGQYAYYEYTRGATS